MPHLTLEYTDNIPINRSFLSLFQAFHEVLVEVGGIKIENCKSRARLVNTYYVGNGEPENAFVHLDVRFMAGRTESVKQSIGMELKRRLITWFEVQSGGDQAGVGASTTSTKGLQITVEVRDIVRREYFKYPEGTLTAIEPE